MSEFLVAHEGPIRLSAFAMLLIGMTAWEFVAPRRRLSVPLTGRWIANIGLVILGALTLRLVLPFAAVGAAAAAAARGWGFFNAAGAPAWLAFAASVVLLDLAIWAQHVVMHRAPWLWRLHRVHHSDLDFDATTAIRFHPFEIVLSMLYKMGVVVILGAPAAAVICFEILLSSGALFTHGNVRLPLALDRMLRWVIVTPDMHRVHHSVRRPETDSNYGFSLSLWDRLFGTYRDQPADGHEGMAIGLDEFRAARDRHLDRLLLQPFLTRRPH